MSNSVDVWVGRFRSRAAFSTYFSETFDEEADDRPISHFAADLGQPFYDHDAIETSFHSRPLPLPEMIAPHSGAMSFLTPVQAVFEEVGWPPKGGRPNTVVLAYDQAIDQPATIERPDFRLLYLGRFPCDLSVAAAEGDAGPPTGIALTIVRGGPITLGGVETTVVAIDARGLLIGTGSGSTDGPPRLDLSGVVPGIADGQLRISRDQFDQWQIEELAGNGLVQFRGAAFSHGRAFPWHGQRIAIGPIEFEWTVE